MISICCLSFPFFLEGISGSLPPPLGIVMESNNNETTVDLSYIEDTLSDIYIEVESIQEYIQSSVEASEVETESSAAEVTLSDINTTLVEIKDFYTYVYLILGIIAGILIFSILANKLTK